MVSIPVILSLSPLSRHWDGSWERLPNIHRAPGGSDYCSLDYKKLPLKEMAWLTNYLWGKARCPSPLLKKYLISSASPGYFNTLATWCKELTHLKRPWCWERLKAGEGADRGWDGWMASPIQWTWVWVNSRSWWWTGRPGVLQSLGWQSVGHNWATELNWNPGLAWKH